MADGARYIPAVRPATPLLLVLALAACDPPADPLGTTGEVTGGTLVLGWIGGERSGDAPEIAIAEALADSLSATLEVREGSIHDLVGALEEGEIHLIGGDLPKSSPFASRYGMSRKIAETRFAGETVPTVMAVRQGENGFLMRLNIALSDR